MEARNIQKVVLINLPTEGKVADFYTPKYAIESFANYPPLGLLYVAAGIKDSYQVKVLDVQARRWGIQETIQKIVEESPQCLGISCQTFYLYPMVAIIKGVKQRLPHLTVVIGGPHTTAFPDETLRLPGVDFCIQGDGDFSFKKLLDALNAGANESFASIAGLIYDEAGQVRKNPPENLNLDTLPIPDRDLLDNSFYYTAADNGQTIVTMISSRGCPLQCVFCDVLEKKYRSRSAKSIVDEMAYIVGKYDNPIVHVFDDTFNLYKRRVMEICAEIKERNLKVKWTTRSRTRPLDEEMVMAMKEAGVVRMHFGVESGSEATLKRVKKGVRKKDIVKAFELCNKYEIDSLAYFIIGFDWETKHEINETVQFIKEIRPSFIMANTLYPAARTESYQILLDSKMLKEDYWQTYAENPTPNFKMPEYLSPKSLSYLRRKLDEIYLAFYLSPTFVLKNLTQKSSSGAKGGSLLFKVNLAFKIIGSFVTNYKSELTTSGKNEFDRPPAIVDPEDFEPDIPPEAP